MKKVYKELMDGIDIFNTNQGHSVDVILRNKNNREVYSTMFARNKRARIVVDIACSLELCEELAKYKALNLNELADTVKQAILAYETGNVDVTKRADIIKQYCLDVAEDINLDLLFNAYCLFDLYSKYNEEEIAKTYNFICDELEITEHKFEEILPSCDLVKGNEKE